MNDPISSYFSRIEPHATKSGCIFPTLKFFIPVLSNNAVFGKAYKCAPQFYNKGVQFGQGELEILLCMMQTVLIIF